MTETPTPRNDSVSEDQKRTALEAALRSNTFARADQIKSFLKYVCEMEIAGRGHELTEYLIGIEALGRPNTYSPGDDSAVRNRAFALRKKLQEFYEHEQPETAIRIELLKGSYCPHFTESHSAQKSNGESLQLSPASIHLVQAFEQSDRLMPPDSEKHSGKKRWLLGFMAGAISTAIVVGAIYLLIAKPAIPSSQHSILPILAEAWGPILGYNADVLVCVANPPSFSVHPSTPRTPSAIVSPTPFHDPGGRPMPQELYDWHNAKFPASSDKSLFLTITTNATYWGDALAAMTAVRTMLSAGAAPQLFPEKVITVPTLRRRNVVLFGAPEYSPAMMHFLEKCPLTVNYLDSIVSAEPGKAPAPLFVVKRDNRNSPLQTFGLITVMPSESTSNHQHRTVIFSGANSAGTQAAAEFFTSPEHLTELKKQLKKDGHETFPPAYQVVVRSETDDSILLNFRYETYRIIPNITNH